MLNTATGQFTFSQFDNYLHDPIQGRNVADGDFEYTIRDGNGNESTATLTLRIIDDVPEISGLTGGVVLDETPGVDADSDDMAGLESLTAQDASVLAPYGPFIQLAQGSVTLGAIDPGVDGVTFDTVVILNSLGNLFGGEDSGLSTTDGRAISLFSVSNTVVEGRDGDGVVVVVLYLNPETGALVLGTKTAIFHPQAGLTPADHDDSVFLNQTFFVGVTDGDGDFAITPNAIEIEIQDDGPTIGNVTGGVILDETPGIDEGSDDLPTDSESVVVGTIVELPGNNSTVDHIHFTVNVGGQVTIDLLSEFGGIDLDGINGSDFFDTFIRLFLDDGNGNPGAQVAVNDDSSTLLSGDGSLTGLDSFLQIDLPPGDYILAVGDFFLSEQEARDGFQSGTDTGGYQVTFTGDITVTDLPGNASVTQTVAPAPLPAPLAALGLSSFGWPRARWIWAR